MSASRKTASCKTASRKTAVPLSRAARRLLDALQIEGAYGVLDAEACSLAVVAPRAGVSVRVASAPEAIADELAAAALAAWEAGARSGRRRLAITDEGRAALARLGAEEGLGFLAQHARLERRPLAGEGRAALVDMDESPLAWLARRRLVSASAFEAGERLRRDLTLAQTLPSVTSRWSDMPTGDRGPGRDHMTDRVVAARQRVDRALAAAGPEFAGLLTDVCGFLKGLETVEAERGWPRRSGKVVLALALARLARHYGLGDAASGPARAPMNHWGAEDYRPRIDGEPA